VKRSLTNRHLQTVTPIKTNQKPTMNHWTERNNALHKTFVFSTFQEAITWMVKASVHIEQLNHHPKWTNVYNTVTVELSTHDEGNIVTEKDRKLAQLLDSI
jgi:4a-hydroxytetrahydrobiopterin dehydratase